MVKAHIDVIDKNRNWPCNNITCPEKRSDYIAWYYNVIHSNILFSKNKNYIFCLFIFTKKYESCLPYISTNKSDNQIFS